MSCTAAHHDTDRVRDSLAGPLGVGEAAPPFEQTLGLAADRFADRVAAVSDSRSMTYRELEQLALACAATLRKNGARPGEATVVLAPNSLAFLVAYFATVMSGGVVTCLSPYSTQRELADILAVTAPTAGVLARRIGGRDIEAELGHLLPPGVIWIDDADVADWPSSADRSVIVARDPSSTGFLAFTSGSTGRPKGATHRADTLIRTSARFLHTVLEDQAVVAASTFPMYNMGGICMMLPVMMGGGTIVVMDGFSGPKLVDAIERHRTSFAVMSPAMAELLLLRGDLGHHDASSFNRVLLCAAPISNQLCRRLARELSAKVFIAYGLTEVPGAWVCTRPDTPLAEIGPLVGWPLDGYELGILSGDGRPLPTGQVGEVCVRTPYMLSGYIGDPESTAAAIDSQSWMHTGDLGLRRTDGALIINGRKKEMYIRGGHNVYPREIEEALLEHPGVELAAVHGMPAPILGEVGWAWVVSRPGSHLGESELRAFLTDRLSYFKVPDLFVFSADLPMSAAGKVDKPALRARAVAMTAEPS